MLHPSEEERDRISRERYEKARLIKGDDQAQTARILQLLDESLAMKPTNCNSLILRSSVSAKVGAYESALTDLNIVIQLESGPLANKRRLPTFYGLRASLFLKMNRPREAINDLTRAVDKESDNGTWLYELGMVYLSQGNALFAQQHFQAALHEAVSERLTHSIKYRCLVALGICQLNAMECAHAVVSFLAADEINDTPSLRNLLGLTVFRQKDYKTAAEHFQRASELDPQVQVYHMHLGICYFRLGRFEGALRHLNEAILCGQGTNTELRFLRGCVNLQLDMVEPALIEFDEAIRIEPEARFFFAKGAAYMRQEKLDAAHAAFKEALAMNPRLRASHIQLGVVAHLRGELHGALGHFHAALEMKKNDAVLLERLGLVFTDLGNHSTAIRYFDRCCVLESSIGRYAFRKGVAQLNSGNPYGAHESLRHAMHLGYADSSLYQACSVAARLLGNVAEAARWSQKAFEYGGKSNPYVILNNGYTEYQLGCYESCLVSTNTTLSMCDAVPEAHYLAAQAHFALKQYADATRSFEAALALCEGLRQHAVFCYALGVSLACQRLWNDAVYWFDKSIENGETGDVTHLVAHHERAKTRQALGDAKGAVEDFSVVLMAQPRNFNALVRRSFGWKQLECFEKSSADWLLARQIDTTGVLKHFDSKDIFTTPYVELCLPGEELRQ